MLRRIAGGDVRSLLVMPLTSPRYSIILAGFRLPSSAGLLIICREHSH